MAEEIEFAHALPVSLIIENTDNNKIKVSAGCCLMVYDNDSIGHTELLTHLQLFLKDPNAVIEKRRRALAKDLRGADRPQGDRIIRGTGGLA